MLALLVAIAFSGDSIMEPHETLAHQSSVRVVAQVAPSITEEMKVQSDSLTRYSVRRLRDAQVPAADDAPAALSLLVTVDGYVKGPGCVYAIRTEAFQLVLPVVGKKPALAGTWSRMAVGFIPVSRPDALRNEIDKYLDEFSAAWHRSHKPQADPLAAPKTRERQM
jgi:hypothetical protein